MSKEQESVWGMTQWVREYLPAGSQRPELQSSACPEPWHQGTETKDLWNLLAASLDKLVSFWFRERES